jgi:plastocyanin
MTKNTSRRRFLKAAAATGVLAGLNATVLAQDDSDEEVILLGGYTPGWQGYRLPGGEEATGTANPTLNLEAGTTYTLMWQNGDGVGHNFAIQDSEGNNLEVLEPLSVSSEVYQQINQTASDQNVTLNMSDGNITGVSNVTDGNMTGENMTGDGQETPSLVAKTEIISEQGAVQAVRFEATEEMSQYICIVHPNSMVGEIQLGGGGMQTTTE